MVRSLLASEVVLYQLVTSRDFVTGTNAQKVERQALADIVTNDMFVSFLQKTIEISVPIDAAIVLYDSNCVLSIRRGAVVRGLPNLIGKVAIIYRRDKIDYQTSARLPSSTGSKENGVHVWR